MKHSPKHVHLDVDLIYGLSALLIVIFSILNFSRSLPNTQSIPTPKAEEPLTSQRIDKAAFQNISVEAKAYIVYDILREEVIASNNETKELPLASITKIMMALSATLHSEKNSYVTITPSSIEGTYDLGLKNKQKWKLSELLKYTLMFSSNDGAEAVADALGGKDAFVLQMNTDAKSFGLKMVFTDPAGRDKGSRIGGIGSALDVAKLFSIARKVIPDVLDTTTKKRGYAISSFGKLNGIPNTNQYIESFSGAEASKTGYTDLAGGNLGVIIDVTLGHPVVFVVLGSSKEGRFRDIELLYSTLKKGMRNTHP